MDPIRDEVNGAMNHRFFLNLSNTWTSKSWATKNADPDPIAILTDIKSSKFVEKNSVKLIPITNPKYTIFLAAILPYDLFAKSVIKKAIG